MPSGPSPYPYHIPVTWWLKNLNYFLFMMRELSAVFVALFLVGILYMLDGLSSHLAEYERRLAWFTQPPVIAFHVVAFAFAVLHTVTWFTAGAVIMPVRIKGKPVPSGMLILGNIAAWLGVSAVLAAFFVGMW